MTPAPVATSGERTAYRFLEFFTAQIRNPHTHRTYAQAVGKVPTFMTCSVRDGSRRRLRRLLTMRRL
jgi:hypothetical protein